MYTHYGTLMQLFIRPNYQPCNVAGIIYTVLEGDLSGFPGFQFWLRPLIRLLELADGDLKKQYPTALYRHTHRGTLIQQSVHLNH